jgi:hypothetical protein
MTIEEYKNEIIKRLGTANDCEEAERVINWSIEFMKDKHLQDDVIVDYLQKLKKGLKELSFSDFDDIHWCNIQDAILYLRKITAK